MFNAKKINQLESRNEWEGLEKGSFEEAGGKERDVEMWCNCISNKI